MPPREITARFTYVRFHGVEGKYNGSYPDERLAGWAAWLAAIIRIARFRGASLLAAVNHPPPPTRSRFIKFVTSGVTHE